MTDYDYDLACARHEEAFRTFDAIRSRYRAGLIDDDTFLAAKAEYGKAMEAYDKAFFAASDIETSDT